MALSQTLTGGDLGRNPASHHKCGLHPPLQSQTSFALPQKCSQKCPLPWPPSETSVISLFIKGTEGLAREEEGREGGEINMMSGFHCRATNRISDNLPFEMYGFPKIRNILFFQKAVGEEIITPIQSVLILIVVFFFFNTTTFPTRVQ